MSIAQNFPEIKPSLNLDFANVKALDSRVTFARASTGAYYDGQTVAKAEENLFSYSQEFDNSYWFKNLTTVIANSITAPDGTTTADTLSAAGTGLNAIVRSILHNSESITFSIYAKEGTKSVLQIDSAQLSGRANFDLATGTLGTVDAAWTASMVNAGNGWYRCVVTFTGTGAAGAFILSMQDSTTAAREATSTAGDLYLWGAQWEVRNAVTAYTPTTTQPITNYIPVLQTASANVARFDHDPVTGESLGLLVEEQRTNLLTYSEQFDNAAWTNVNSTDQTNVIVAPDGTLTGDKLIGNSGTSQKYIKQDVSVTSGTTYSFSVFAKQSEFTLIQLRFSNGQFGNSEYATFSLVTGEIAQSSGSGHNITSIGNGWYRCTIVGVCTTTGSAENTIQLATSTSGGRNPLISTGDGYSGIYIWGAQLEAGAFPTSYIPTVASQVTRSADSASMTGTNFSDWYRADEGTVYAEAMSDEVGSRRVFAVTDGSAYAQRISSYFGTATHFRLRNESNGLNIDLDAGTQTAGMFGKVAGSYAIGAQAVSLNGGTVAFATDTRSMPLVDRLFIGADAFDTNRLNGHIRKIAYYPLALTNTNLQALTS
jgi:hypothetical protein